MPHSYASAPGMQSAVSPSLGHANALTTLIDRELLRFDTVYAAGGTPHAMFPLTPADLVRITTGTVVDIALFAPQGDL